MHKSDGRGVVASGNRACDMLCTLLKIPLPIKLPAFGFGVSLFGRGYFNVIPIDSSVLFIAAEVDAEHVS